MTLDEVCDLTRRSSSTIYADMDKGIFPEPVKLGSSSRWLKTEVLAYIAEQAAKRGSG
nr:helix-turn-helix domain-containing protein [Qipengyuania qiaonensis]